MDPASRTEIYPGQVSTVAMSLRSCAEQNRGGGVAEARETCGAEETF